MSPLLAIAAVAALLLVRLSGFGIWDPWEVEVAEPARRLAAGESVRVPHVGFWLVSQGFRLFGVHEWSGRLPIALGGVAMVALTYALVARFVDRRAGIYAVLIAGTSPLFIFNARTMLGEAPAFALQTAIALCAAMAVFCRGRAAARLGWLAAALLACGAGAWARGALLCVLPPLAAVVIVAALEGRLRGKADDGADPLAARVLLGALLLLGALVARDIANDAAGFSVWLGGSPEGGQPPSFDAELERVFHAFAPWSVLLPLALARLPLLPNAPPERQDPERRLRLLLVLWIAFSYGALTLFMSRYGHKVALAPVAALAGAVALLLRDVERGREALWPAAIGALLLGLLLIRDYALYPIGPVHGMPLADFTVPDVFNPSGHWAALIGLFCVAAVLALGAHEADGGGLALAGPYRLIQQQWRRGLADKLWLLALGSALLACAVFGLMCLIPPLAALFTTLAVKVGKALLLVALAIPLLVVAAQLMLYAYAKLRDRRSLPVLVAGACVGGYAAFGFMPALSAHFSPREVYETYNQLAGSGETLVEYKVGARAAAYYAKGAAAEVETLGQLMKQLISPERRWAVFPSADLPSIDRMFRARTGHHLFVADARNARVLLASNLAVPGRRDQSFLSEFVKREAPPIKHPLHARFDDSIELLGYDLRVPHGDHVGAGEYFELTWYFKALRPAGNYRVFVHIDAETMRIHGDHDPVDGQYPVRLWDPGDVIIDRQNLEVPPTYPPGPYTIYVGFYEGDTRMPVTEGPKDNANRVIAGVLRIR